MFKAKLIAAGVAFILLAGVTWPWWTYRTTETVTILSKEKDDKQRFYQVFTPDEVFILNETWWYLIWDTATPYGNIIPGKQYQFGVYGVRFPNFDLFRNIVSIEEIK